MKFIEKIIEASKSSCHLIFKIARRSYGYIEWFKIFERVNNLSQKNKMDMARLGEKIFNSHERGSTPRDKILTQDKVIAEYMTKIFDNQNKLDQMKIINTHLVDPLRREKNDTQAET